MKKKLLVSVGVVSVVLFAACSSEKDYYDPNSILAQKEAQYEAAFAKRYGTIAPDQNWGFEEKSQRGVDPTANMWGEYVDVPQPVEETEKEKVIKWFKEHKNPESQAVNWSDFFIQQVYKGEATYIAGNGGQVTGSNQMNKLVVGENDEHAYNFNNGDCSETNVNNQYNDKIMFMVNSSTKRFGYSNSLDGGKNYYDYTIQEIDGSYYVGFDFSAKGQNPNEQVDADGYYSDWIVKIGPATYKNAKRIIAEDLGNTDDFDFNDVVFDVALRDNASIITLRAAGGTLPLFIGVGDEKREVHELFEVSTSTMVNTGGVSKAPVIFRLPLSSDPNEVQIWVESAQVGAYYLKAECGKAPQKICVPTTYEWTNERVGIDKKYPKFKDWVGNTDVDWLGE